MSSNQFIIKAWGEGVKVLTIKDLSSNEKSLHHLIDNSDDMFYPDSLAL